MVLYNFLAVLFFALLFLFVAKSHEKINSTAIQNFNKVRLLWRCANLK